MASYNALSARYDELRSPNPPPTSNTTGTTTPTRYSGSFIQNQSQTFNDARGNLQRRQTTDLSKMPGIAPIGQQPAQVADPVDLPPVCTPDFQLSRPLSRDYVISFFALFR